MFGGFSFRKLFLSCCQPSTPDNDLSEIVVKPERETVVKPGSEIVETKRIPKILTPRYTIKISKRFDSFKSRNDKIESSLDSFASDLLKENRNIQWVKEGDDLMYMKIYVRKIFYEMLKESILNYKLESKILLDKYMSEQMYFCAHRIYFFSRGLTQVVCQSMESEIKQFEIKINRCKKEIHASDNELIEKFKEPINTRYIQEYKYSIRKLSDLREKIKLLTEEMLESIPVKGQDSKMQKELKFLMKPNEDAGNIVLLINKWKVSAEIYIKTYIKTYIKNNELIIVGEQIRNKNSENKTPTPTPTSNYLSAITEVINELSNIESEWSLNYYETFSEAEEHYVYLSRRHDYLKGTYKSIKDNALEYKKLSIIINGVNSLHIAKDRDIKHYYAIFDSIIENNQKITNLESEKKSKCVVKYSLYHGFIKRYNLGLWYDLAEDYDSEIKKCFEFDLCGWVGVKEKIKELVKDKENLWSDIMRQSPLFRYTERGLHNIDNTVSILSRQPDNDMFSKGMIKLLSKDNFDKAQHSKKFFFFKEGAESIDMQQAGGTCVLHVVNEINLDASHGLCFYVTAYRYELLFQAIFANAICDEKYTCYPDVKQRLKEYMHNEIKCDITPSTEESIMTTGNMFLYDESPNAKLPITKTSMSSDKRILILSELTDDMVGHECYEDKFEDKDTDYIMVGVREVKTKDRHAILAKKKDDCIYILDSNYEEVQELGKLDARNILSLSSRDLFPHKQPVLAMPGEQNLHQGNLEEKNENKQLHLKTCDYDDLSSSGFFRITK